MLPTASHLPMKTPHWDCLVSQFYQLQKSKIKMPFGYHGRILHVDLNHGQLEVEQPDEGFYRQYMGGSTLGLYYLLKHTPPHTAALDPKIL